MAEYYDLGTYSRSVTTTSAEAQCWFDRGLIWCYGYNHEESVACFTKATEADPDCAMAYWGIAYAAGPNYNKPWELFDEADLAQSLHTAYSAAQTARAKMAGVSAVEQALINAIQARYPSSTPIEDLTVWNDAYADAMRDVYRNFGNDIDVATLFAEALMNRTPWKLWDLKRGTAAADASTMEAVTVLEHAIQQVEQTGPERHPGLLHVYIHLMEMSPYPQVALRAADDLRGLVPDAGHLEHMSTHIDVLCGHYQNVVASNTRAIVADRRFLERAGAMNFYSLYRVHNYHFKLYGAMFLGQYRPALEAVEELHATIPEALLRMESPPMANWIEGYMSMKPHVYIRFGKWQEILNEPLPVDQELFCVTTAILHYAKGVAHATLGNIAAAEAEQALFNAAVSRVPDTRYIHTNPCLAILGVAEQMLAGELEYRKANYDVAFKHLREAVAREDALPYDEPWGWMQPARHALGALLLEQHHIEDAEAVYRADLGLDQTLSRASQHPDNVWSLHGLHECLLRLGKSDEATMVKLRLDLANARADMPIQASCFCRLQHAT
jgi:tetratricopeptide (TPR) repeat protein